uniref:Phage protein n=1 Tax=Salmonella phage vB_SEnST11_KE22 TaxID=3161173 RepID=A0AAU8GFP2_9CAUD
MDYAKKNSSLTWFDYLWCRALKNFKGESYSSLESADMAYLLKLNEYLDVEEFVSDVHEKEEESKARANQAANRPRRGRRG